MHPLPGRHFEEVEQRLALAEAVPPDRNRAEVERAGAEEDEVAHDPVKFEVDHTQILGALGNLNLEQLLDGAAIGHRVEVVGDVVHPLDDWDRLPIALLLGGLLNPGVEVAEDRLQAADHFAVERHQQAQHAVCCRVVRAKVQRQQLAVALELGRLRERDALLHLAVCAETAGGRINGAHSNHLGTLCSLWVKRIGSPPIGKSRRCG
uniref:Unannotated protein n=1 Tax=freshwater metagenome TaxID=449393 RepID=A0A6J5ZYB1_9ZZZZ